MKPQIQKINNTRVTTHQTMETIHEKQRRQTMAHTTSAETARRPYEINSKMYS